ncbi:hypothetical protein [Ideonella sp.]|uniref:hypothetical protein n=1 Tax=Ideonella sp. TaxID=1929293 RepID=UPI003BB5B21D
MIDTPPPQPASAAPKRPQLTRLLKIWRSDGWPSRDALEIELLAAGWVSVVMDGGHEKLRLTESGLAQLAASRQRNQRSLSAHDRLAERVAWQLHEAGRVVWRELSLRAKVATEPADAPPAQALDLFAPQQDAANDPTSRLLAAEPEPPTAPFEPTAGGWRMARPDVFSVRNTSVEAYLHPVVHEIKVSRADLFSDLRHAAKRASYQWLCCECHYVFPAGMAQPEELPEALGVWVIHGDIDTGRLEQLRPARHASCTLPFAVWLALAKSSPWQPERDPRQIHLGQPDGPLPGTGPGTVSSLFPGDAELA